MNTVDRFQSPNVMDSEIENALISFSICRTFPCSHNKFAVKITVYRTTVVHDFLFRFKYFQCLQSAILNILTDGRVVQPATKARNRSVQLEFISAKKIEQTYSIMIVSLISVR